MAKRWMHPEFQEFLLVVAACYFALWLGASNNFFHRLSVAVGGAILIAAYKQKQP